MAVSLAAAKFGRTGPGLSLSRANEVNYWPGLNGAHSDTISNPESNAIFASLK